MSDLESYKTYTRILILVVLVVLSVSFLFGFIGADDTPEGGIEQQTESILSFTELQLGIELSGGTRITAPLHGATAEGVELEESADTAQIERDIADTLSESRSDVTVFLEFTDGGQPDSIIEVTSETASENELESALEENEIGYDSVRSGVSSQTQERTAEVVTNKINESGLSGGTARITQSATGESFLLVEIPGADRESVIEVLSSRGAVQVDLYYPQTAEDGSTEYVTDEELLNENSFQRVGSPNNTDELGPHVPVTLNEDSAVDFRERTTNAGMVPSGSACRYDTSPENTGPCLLTLVDGEIVYSAGMSPNLAQSIATGNWVQDPTFVLQTEDLAEAQELSLHLSAGQLPTAINFDEGTSVFISATQGEQFIISSLIVSLLAIIGVSAKVYYRYRELEVVVPMIATSLCEVVILLGFAAFTGYPIGLAVIGGFVAVIGTGVDDLIIITNEILTKETISSQTVFDNRYDKAFWIIAAAAATTILALTPLLVLSLGELQGFAIFTIIGILVGVFITRPAYAKILNYILLKTDSTRYSNN